MSRGFLLADIHIGLHPLNEDKWLEILREYFYDFFFPLLDKEYKKGDFVYILGDLFHIRDYISLKCITFALDIFSEFENKKIKIRALIGNHDMYNSNSYEHYSLKILNKFKNIEIVKKPTIFKQSDKEILMMPWINSTKEEKKLLTEYTGKVDYLFCHSDLNGAKTNMKIKLMSSITVENFKGFPKVYAGHIHIRQKLKNFTFVGNPFHMDRNDTGNQKGVYIINFKDDSDIFIENNISPVYKTIILKDLNDKDKIDIIKNNKKDFIDVVVHNSLLTGDKKIRREIEKLSKDSVISSLSQIDDKEDDEIDIEDSDDDFNIEDVMKKHISKKQKDKKRIIKMQSILDECIKASKDKLK